MANERLIDKAMAPTDADMIATIGPALADAWTGLRSFIVDTYDVVPILQYGGKRYGWNIQHRKGGRPLCELYPEHDSFTALVVLGKKELDEALQQLETFGSTVQQVLVHTHRHHDGCWLYIRVAAPLTCEQDVADIQRLIFIKKKPPKKSAIKS